MAEQKKWTAAEKAQQFGVPVDTIYTARIFLNCVIPLFREIAMRMPALRDKFSSRDGVIQIAAETPEGKWGTHFILASGDMTTHLGVHEAPDVELCFKSLEHLNAFFKNQTKALPKLKGILKLGLFIPTMKTLLKMSALLSAKEAPADPDTKALLTRLYFYLLSSGISQLNKLGHPDVSKWAKMSPDRVYAWTVDGHVDIAAYIRVKAGNSKSSKGQYQRSKPFFTMRFADIDSALAILLQTGDLLALTAEEKLIMEGAPEFGAKLGDFMMLVGAYAQ